MSFLSFVFLCIVVHRVCVGSIRSSVTGLLAFAKTIHVYANIKNVFINFFWFKYIFPTKFEIVILDKMFLQKKNGVSFERLHYSNNWSPVS